MAKVNQLTYDDRDDLELGTEMLAELLASDYFSCSSFVGFGTKFLPESKIQLRAKINTSSLMFF